MNNMAYKLGAQFADKYLLEQLKRLPKHTFPNALIASVGGGAVGGIVDDEDRLKGTLLGALSGGSLGAGLSVARSLSSMKRFAEIQKLRAIAPDFDEFDKLMVELRKKIPVNRFWRATNLSDMKRTSAAIPINLALGGGASYLTTRN